MEENNTNRLISWFSLLVILAAIIAVGVIFYWISYPFDVLEIKKLPVPITKPEDIKAGKLIILSFDYCKYMDVQGKVERQLVSDRMTTDLPSYRDSTPKSCDIVEAPTLLPYNILEPQKFHIHYKITYQVNPLRTVIEEFDTETFTIEPIVDFPSEEEKK